MMIMMVMGLEVRNMHAAVQLAGHIDSEYYSTDGKLANRGRSHFRVVRDFPRWQLITEQAGSESYSITSDGASTFTIISATNISPRMLVRGATNMHARMQVGILDPWNAAIDTPAENLPWYFLVLSKEFNTRLADLPVPWNMPRSEPQAFFCSNSIQWSDTQSGFVARAAFFYSSDKVLAALDSPILNKTFRSSVSRDDANVLSSTLRNCTNTVKAGETLVLDWTNSPYGKYPLKFECLVFDSLAEQLYDSKFKKFLPEHASRVPAVAIKYFGTITSVEEVASVVCPPPLRRPTWVADNRFRDTLSKVQRVEYGPVEDWITDRGQVRTTAAGLVRIETIKMATEQAPSWVRWPFVVLLLLALGFPLLAKRLWKGTNKPQVRNR